jgi:ribosome-associated protein
MDESWSRTDQKRANRAKEDALARLTDDLAQLSEPKIAELELSDGLYDAVVSVRRIKSAAARNRQLRRIRALLRDEDHAAIRARLMVLRETGSATRTPRTAGDDERNRLETSWTLRLVGEGTAGLDAFLLEFPKADRTHLRQLVRNVTSATHVRREKAEHKLRAAVRSFLS